MLVAERVDRFEDSEGGVVMEGVAQSVSGAWSAHRADDGLRLPGRIRRSGVLVALLGMLLAVLALPSGASAAEKGVVGYFGNPIGSSSALAGQFNGVQGSLSAAIRGPVVRRCLRR